MLWSLTTEVRETSELLQQDAVEFIVCCQEGGRLIADTGDAREIAFLPGRLVLIPPNTAYRIVIHMGDVARLKIACCPPSDLPRFLSPKQVALVCDVSKEGITVSDFPDHLSWLEATINMISDGFSNENLLAEQVSWSAVGLLLSLHVKGRTSSADNLIHRYRGRMQEVVSWIEDNLHEVITLDQAARLFGMSRSLLTREFRQHTGKSIVDFRNTLRLQKAASRLSNPTETVTGAAIDSGFSSVSQFHRKFKEHFGLTPTAFRKKRLNADSLDQA
jgi:AraC family transcriptional activator of mar-sox-rob regulon